MTLLSKAFILYERKLYGRIRRIAETWHEKAKTGFRQKAQCTKQEIYYANVTEESLVKDTKVSFTIITQQLRLAENKKPTRDCAQKRQKFVIYD